MTENLEGFEQWVEPSIRDHLLDRREEAHYLNNADAYGLSEERAKRFLIELCVERGVAIERLATRRLRDLVEIAAGGDLVDGATIDLLERAGRDQFTRGVPEDALDSSGPKLEDLVRDTVERALADGPARPVADLEQAFQDGLESAAVDRRVDPDEARRIYTETIAAHGLDSAESAEMVAIFHDTRRERGIEIGQTESDSEEGDGGDSGELPGETEHAEIEAAEVREIENEPDRTDPDLGSPAPSRKETTFASLMGHFVAAAVITFLILYLLKDL